MKPWQLVCCSGAQQDLQRVLGSSQSVVSLTLLPYHSHVARAYLSNRNCAQCHTESSQHRFVPWSYQL